MKKIIVISAVNLRSGGTLTILQECLHYASSVLAKHYKVIALVSNKKLAEYENIEYIEFPRSKKSWLIRLYYEYIYFYFLSKKLKPYLWLSLHDITPNVNAKIRAVYCHNPSPFYKATFRDLMFSLKFYLFSRYYKYLYKINIRKNDYVIVQQEWIRQAFQSMYKINSVVVAQPIVKINFPVTPSREEKLKKKYQFVYPAFPRAFKNYEIICEAARILENSGFTNFQVILTISGSENGYSKYIYKKFKHLKTLRFVGILSRADVFSAYQDSDCLIFPSKLETWGLPITEFSLYKKPIILINLPYAHETVGAYDRKYFFEPDNAAQLSQLMLAAMQNKLPAVIPHENESLITAHKLIGWEELFAHILKNNN